MRLISDILILSTIFMTCYGSEGEKEKDNFEHWPQTVLLPIGVGSKRTFNTPVNLKGDNKFYGLAFNKKQLYCGEASSIVQFPQIGLLNVWTSSLTVDTNCNFNPLRIKYGKTAYASLQTSPGDVCYGSLDCDNRYVTPQSQVPHRNEYSNAHNPIQSLPKDIDFCESNADETTNPDTKKWYFTEDGYDKCTEKSSSTETDPVSVAPRYLKDGEEFADVRPFWYFNTTVPRPTFDFVPSPKIENGYKWKECGSTCDVGKVVKLHMEEKGSYNATVAVENSCKRIKVCFMSDIKLKNEEKSPAGFFTDQNGLIVPRCSRGLTMYILIDANTVIWPTEGAQASIIELKSSGGKPVTFEFGFGRDGKAEFYVANHYREMVTSDSGLGFQMKHAHYVMMVFDNKDCLVSTRGIYSRTLHAAFTWVTDATVVNPGPKLTNDAQANVEAGKVEEYLPPVEQPDEALVGTTTIPPPVAQLGAAVALEGIISAEQDPRKYLPGKWWTWGLYFGFLLGTILTIVIVGAVVFLLRRTIYSIWYRGMFKRYGVDASGTAGGITGVGFGNTTTGAMTVSNTTGGGTTAGTTATSGTTGGDTTGGTTGGTSTIGDTKKSDTLAL